MFSKKPEKKGFKESRIQGVEWFSWYFFSKLKETRSQKSEDSRGRVKRAEGWKVRGLDV